MVRGQAKLEILDGAAASLGLFRMLTGAYVRNRLAFPGRRQHWQRRVRTRSVKYYRYLPDHRPLQIPNTMILSDTFRLSSSKNALRLTGDIPLNRSKELVSRLAATNICRYVNIYSAGEDLCAVRDCSATED